MTVADVSDTTFEQEVFRSELPVLVDLFADWCEPCKAIAPILDELSAELQNKIKIVRVNVERNPIIAQSFRVQSIPMLVLFHQGQLVDSIVGAVDKQALLKMVKPVLPASADEVAPKELSQQLAQQLALPVDIRDAGTFGRYHIPEAINIPAGEIETRLADLQPSDGRRRVLYGRSTDDAKEWAEKLRAQGVPVAFLSGGFLHWEAEGLEVER